MATKSFTEVEVWQLAHKFVLKVYNLAKDFPKDEIYGLTSQFRRSAISIAANIAEGYKKRSKKDKLRFYNIAQGSLEECRYYIILANDLGYGYSNEMDELIDTISRKLYGYMKTIEESMV